MPSVLRVLPVVVCLLGAVAAHAAEADLQALLDRHLRTDVVFWLDEPRLYQLLRENNERNAPLSDEQVAALDAQWQAERAAEEGPLVDRVETRFASGYFDEVILRMDGTYATIVALDRRGLVAAASDLPAHFRLGDEPAAALLAQHPDAPWAQDGRPAPDALVHLALPIADPANGERLGTLLLAVDAGRLARQRGSVFGEDLVGAFRLEGSPVIR